MTSDEISKYHRNQLIDQLAVLEFILADLSNRRDNIRKVLKLKKNEVTACEFSDSRRQHVVEMIEQCLINLTYKSHGLGKLINK